MTSLGGRCSPASQMFLLNILDRKESNYNRESSIYLGRKGENRPLFPLKLSLCPEMTQEYAKSEDGVG